MTDIAQASARLAAAVSAREKTIDPARHGWLAAIRRGALAAFEARGLPSSGDERWRYAPVGELAERLFLLPPPADLERIDRAALQRASLPALSAFRLVFVDGHFVAELSSRALPRGQMTIASLAAAVSAEDPRVAPALGRVAGYLDQGLTALNTALFGDGALVALDPGVELDVPVHLVFLTSGQTPRAAIYPRVLVALAPHSRLTLVESHLGDGGPSFTNAVTEIALGDGAQLDHLTLQRDRGESFTVASATVHLAAGSRYAGHALVLGSRLSRHEVSVTCSAPGAEVLLSGLSLARGDEQVDQQTAVRHDAPECTSDQLFKTVADDRAVSVFGGAIHVAPQAAKTNARQTNRNLLLGERASANAKPELEINNDDVQCAHGATVGRLDEQALFFLRARGLDAAVARQMLVRGFVGEWIERVPDALLRRQLEGVVHPWLVETSDER